MTVTKRAATARTYLFALTDAGGTVPPEVGVVRRLVERGHRVTVLADDTMADQVRATGAAFLPWSEKAEVFNDWAIKNPMKMAEAMADQMMVGPAAGHARDTAEMIDELKPDLVVTSSMGVGGMIAAEARGIPFDTLIPNIYVLPAPGIPPMGAGLKPAKGPLGRLRDRLVTAASGQMFNHYTLADLNAVRKEYGLEPIASAWHQMQHARHQLTLTSAAFDFPGELPANASYVGPILDDPAWAADEAWTPPPGDDPLVLVAMSSTFQNHVDCLQRITDALGTLPVRGLVTTGPAVRPEQLSAPANVTIVASAPHSEVLKHASLVVTHGGHGTVIKTLAAGLPLVVLHHGRDQADNAARVTERGVGIAVPRGASSQRIADAITKIIATPSYREKAASLGKIITKDAASSALLDELER